MHTRKNKAELSVVDAVDNLSHMAEIDVTTSSLSATSKELTEQQIGERMHALSWHDPEYYAYNRERVRETFLAIHKYLQDLYERDKGHLKESGTQRGIQAIMVLASEAAQKVDQFTEIFQQDQKVTSVTELKEYKDLQHFYLTKVVQRFQTILDEVEMGQLEGKLDAPVEFQEREIGSLDSVRGDKAYELFSIRREDGKPFFNRALLRHIQLIGNFDGLLEDPSQENLFLHIHASMDRDTHISAKEILNLASPYIDDYYKEAMKFKQMGFVAAMNKALMALMLAANARNLTQTAAGKSSLNYYADFHYYLRTSLSTPEYKRYLTDPPDSKSRFLYSLMNLSHVLCTSFFLKIGSRKDMISFIHLLIEKGSHGSKIDNQSSSPLSLWNTLLDQDDNIRFLLKHYPNGPLKKTLKMFSDDAVLQGFDPIGQQNLPSQMYTLVGDEMHMTCIRLPSPTMQSLINKADVIEEFYGFLRSLQQNGKQQRHLLINLQDRTSFHEYARCNTLESISKKQEFSNAIVAVTLSRSGGFYLQSGSYLEVNDASEFMLQLKDQIASAEQCGFYFPPAVKLEEILKFSDAAIQMIHAVFFANKELLLQKNRLDFIEIFYLMLTIRLLEMFKPDTVSLTCKDAVDTGTIASVELFAFLRMMNGKPEWSVQEKDFLLWMLYAPALAVRNRAIDIVPLTRMVSALSLVAAELEAHPNQTLASCSSLYATNILKGLKIKEVS